MDNTTDNEAPAIHYRIGNRTTTLPEHYETQEAAQAALDKLSDSEGYQVLEAREAA